MYIARNKMPESRTVEHALTHAQNTRRDLPYVIQVYPYDWDIVILADEVYRLRKKLNEITKIAKD